MLAAVARMRDKLTAVAVLVHRLDLCVRGRLTRAVGLGHHETSQDGPVEGGIGTAYSQSAHAGRNPKADDLRARNLYRRTNNLT